MKCLLQSAVFFLVMKLRHLKNGPTCLQVGPLG